MELSKFFDLSLCITCLCVCGGGGGGVVEGGVRGEGGVLSHFKDP